MEEKREHGNISKSTIKLYFKLWSWGMLALLLIFNYGMGFSRLFLDYWLKI